MTSIGTRISEPKNATGQEVLWLSSSEPPAPLLTFLRGRGLTLVARGETTTSAPLRLLWIDASKRNAARAPNLGGRRIAVMHPDPGNADALAQALRAKGAEVVALSLNPESLHRVEMLDPDAVIMEAEDFSSSCWEIVRALWQHPRLRFATIVLATPELMGSQVTALDVHDLSFAIADVAADYTRVAADAKRGESFSFELETLGPSRALRALLEGERALRVVVHCSGSTVEVDLAEQIVVGAQSPAGAPQGEGLLGVHALQFLLAQREGRVEVRAVDHPAHTNVMAPLETALHMAHEAASAVRPSGLHRPQPTNPGFALGTGGGGGGQARAGQPKAPALHSRTLIGVPAVKIPAAAKEEESAAAKGAAVLAKSFAPPRPGRDGKPEPAPAAKPAASARKHATMIGMPVVARTEQPARPAAAEPAPAAKAEPTPAAKAEPAPAAKAEPTPAAKAAPTPAAAPAPAPAAAAPTPASAKAKVPTKPASALASATLPPVAPTVTAPPSAATPRAAANAAPPAPAASTKQAPAEASPSAGAAAKPIARQTFAPTFSEPPPASRAARPATPPPAELDLGPSPELEPVSSAVDALEDDVWPSPQHELAAAAALYADFDGAQASPSEPATAIFNHTRETPATPVPALQPRELPFARTEPPPAEMPLTLSESSESSESGESSESSALDGVVADENWARPRPSWQRKLRALGDKRPLRFALIGVAAAALCGAIAYGFSGGSGAPIGATPLPSMPVLPVAQAAAPVEPVADTRPAAPAAAKTRAVAEGEDGESEDDELAGMDSEDKRVSARRAAQLVGQGNTLRKKRKTSAAHAKYLEALEAFPDYPRALAGLVHLALAQHDKGEAVDYAKKLVKSRPGQGPYQLLLGDAQREAGNIKEAKAAYQIAVRLGSRAAKERLSEL